MAHARRGGGPRRRARGAGCPRARCDARSAELLEGMFATAHRRFSLLPLGCRLRRLSRRKRALPLLAGRCAAGTRPVIAFAEFLHCALLPARAALAQPNVTPRKQISRLTALPLHVWGSVPLGRISAWSSLAALTYVRIGGCAGGAPPRRCRSACGRGGAPASPAGATVCFTFRAAKCSKSQEISCFQSLVPQGVWIGARLRRKQI